MADKTKIIWVNGSTIKQGDTSSVFKLKLLTEDDVELKGAAKLQLIGRNKAKVEYDVDVVDNIIEFKLDRVLPVDVYIVEVEHAGYVFPSKELTTLKVTENQGDYITDEVAGLLSVDEYIKQKSADFQSGQIDLDELASKLNIPQYDDTLIKAQISDILAEIESLKNQTTYDDSELRSQIKALSEHLDNDTVYDDSDVKSRLSALESKADNDTVYDDSELKSRLTALENKTDNDTIYDDSELKREIENLKAGQTYDDSGLIARIEKLEKTGGSSTTPRYGPTGYTLVFEGDDYIIAFDNGARLIIGYANAKDGLGQIRGLTGIGKPHPFDGRSNTLAADPLPYSIMRTSARSVQIATWESSNGIAVWYREGIRVENPVRDSSKCDFSNAYYNRNDTNPTSLANQPRLIEIYYQLGLFSDSELERFGVVKR